MYVDDALPLLKNCIGIKFKQLYKNLPSDLRTNKGNAGQLLLLHIGCKLDSELTDFYDGELKTNKSNSAGVALETMFITQISRQIDTFVSPTPTSFLNSDLYKKIRRLIILPVCKDAASSDDWYFVDLLDVNLDVQSDLRSALEADYYSIIEQMKQSIETSRDGNLHTANGNLLQIRTKDSKPYHPIFSRVYNRYVSDKNFAFYFKKEFMKKIKDKL